MKKILLLATMVLGVVSCMKEYSFESSYGEETDVKLTVALPDVATRSAGANSAKGAIGNIDLDNDYDIRYVLGVYDTNGTLIKGQYENYEDKSTATEFVLRLVPGRNYRFVVWADFVKQGKKEQLHYDATDLKNVKLSDTSISLQNPMDESRDAYTAVEEVKNFNSSTVAELVLTRPFAKLRVVTNDVDELYSQLQSATVNYTSKIYTAFNALTAKVAGQPVEISKSVDFTNPAYLYANESAKAGEVTLFADYIFGTEDYKVQFSMDVADAVQPLPQILFNTDIPVKRNHLTTIYGPILTDSSNIVVEIRDTFEATQQVEIWDGVTLTEPEFDSATNTYIVSSGAELAWMAALVNGTLEQTASTRAGSSVNITLDADINLGNNAWTPIGATGKFKGVFDGANHVIGNLSVASNAKTPVGLLANGTYVRNITVRNATIKGHYKAGVIVGDGLCSRIENCHVDGANVTVVPLNNDDANHAGGIVGYLSAENTAYVKNCSVKNATITAYRDVAAIAGTANQAAVVSGNSVENVTVVANQCAEYVEQKVANVGVVVGRLHAKAVLENNTALNSDAYVVVDTAQNLDYQLAKATGDIKVVLGADLAGNVTILQREGVNVVVDGANNEFDGVITINGNARAAGEETLTIANVNFATAGSDFTFISAPSKVDGKYNYSHNVTIEGCTFKANQTVGCANFNGTYHFVMKNCVAENVHSIAQLQSVDNDVTIEDIVVKDSKNGLSFGNTKTAVLKNATIEALGYGVRADGAKERATTIAIADSSISAYIPVSVRKMNNNEVNVTVAFTGENNLVEAGAWDVAFCSNEYEEGVEPVEALGAYEVTGGDAFKVYPRDLATRVDGIEDFADFKTPNTSGDEVYYLESGNYKLTDDITFDARIDIQPGQEVTIDLNGQELASEADYFFMVREGASLVIDGEGVVNCGANQLVFYPAGNLTINGGTFICEKGDGTGSMFVGTKPTGGWESTGVTINGGYFDCGYYDSNADNIEELLAGTMTLEETADDIKKRGVSGDKNKVRVALKNNVQNALNRSNNYFKIYGGSFVGVNPAWGDEGCMLPTTPNYLRPWSYYQGALLDGQTFHEDGIVLPEGYEITKSTHEDGRPIYTVTYNSTVL